MGFKIYELVFAKFPSLLFIFSSLLSVILSNHAGAINMVLIVNHKVAKKLDIRDCGLIVHRGIPRV